MKQEIKFYIKMRQREGFTLIELLVVVMVIGILVTLLLGAYQSATRTSKFQAFLDDVLAEIKEARDLSVAGLESRNFADKNCYGVSFFRNSDKEKSTLVVGDFGEADRHCTFSADQGYLREYSGPPGFQINRIYTAGDGCNGNAGGICEKEMIIYFMPPNGAFGAVRRGRGYVDQQNDDLITIELGQKGADLSSVYVKAIDIDYPTGKIEIRN